jgi:hypothetical protein
VKESKTMNALEFLPFLGHSSIYPPFDEFLTRNGVVKRPSMKKNVDNTITVSGHGLTLSFTFGIKAEKDGFKIKSEGTFIFVKLEIAVIAQDRKDGKYSGQLPHGLAAVDTRQSVEKKLGIPKRRNPDSDNYYLDDLVWIVAYEGEKLEFIQLFLPDNGWREHGICP